MHGDTFHIKPWTPALAGTADKIIHKIHEAAPELEVLFMGAAALGLPGKNDIDLDILCDGNEIEEYIKKLNPIFGEPINIKQNLAEWKFEYEGYEIDAILSDPKTSHVPLQRKRFDILKSDKRLRKEYRKLKEECDGLVLKEYEKRKNRFFEEKVLSSKG